MQKFMVGLLIALWMALPGCTGNRELHVAAGQGNLAKVQAEISKGTDVDVRDAADQTALMYAAEAGRLDIVKCLVEHGASVNARTGNFGRGTALIYAAANNRLDVMEYLLDQGAHIDAITHHHETALFWAAAMGHKEAVTLLLNRNADASIKNTDGKTAADVAKEVNREDIRQMLSGKR